MAIVGMSKRYFKNTSSSRWAQRLQQRNHYHHYHYHYHSRIIMNNSASSWSTYLSPISSTTFTIAPMDTSIGTNTTASTLMLLSSTATSRRWNSTTSTSTTTDNKKNNDNNNNDNNDNNFIPLQTVPMLPYLGSLVSAYSKSPNFDPNTFLEYYPELRRRFGNFYKFGLPGIGKGTKGEIHVLVDPYEYQKIIRQNDSNSNSNSNTSGSNVCYPRGFIEAEWPLIEYLQSKQATLAKSKFNHHNNDKNDNNNNNDDKGFYGRGPTWKRLRSFLQVDLLSPAAAKGYIPGMVQAAQIASNAIEYRGKQKTNNTNIFTMSSSTTERLSFDLDDCNLFLNQCAFDMFCTVMFGELTQTVHPKYAKALNVLYCEKTIEGFHLMTKLFFDPIELFQIRFLQRKTPLQQQMLQAFDIVFEMSHEKYIQFKTIYDKEQEQQEQQSSSSSTSSSLLTPLQANSYLANALRRQPTTDITNDEISDMIKVMLSAAIDTTSSVLGWNLYHLAVNRHVQERLYQELQTAITKEQNQNQNDQSQHGILLTESILQKSSVPYFHAIIRESHRISPSIPVPIQKENTQPIEIHGTVFPPNTLFFLDTYSIGMDPNYATITTTTMSTDENGNAIKKSYGPKDFYPDRWLVNDDDNDNAIQQQQQQQQRKNETTTTTTSRESQSFLNHPYYKSPFSEGSRKCPGSRVASYEIMVLLGQFILDWEISAPPDIQSFDDMKYSLTGIVTPKLPTLTFTKRK